MCALEESVGERETHTQIYCFLFLVQHNYTVLLLFTRKGKRQKEGNPQLICYIHVGIVFYRILKFFKINYPSIFMLV